MKTDRWILTSDNTTIATYVYGDVDNWNAITGQSASVGSDGGAAWENLSPSAHKRRAYPGDPTPADVRLHTRSVLKDLNGRSGNALPGRPFQIGKLINGKYEKRQFTYTGSASVIRESISESTTGRVDFWSPCGKWYGLDETDVGGGD